MKKNWLVATYKINEARRVEINLLNQKFDYYLPKITTLRSNSTPIEEPLFPGYIFVKSSFENYPTLKYTFGIKNIIKFGDNVASISDEEINAMQMVEEASKTDPVASQIQIGQDVIILEGSLKGIIARVCSLPSKKRVDVLLSFLGSERRINIAEKFLSF